MTEKTNNVNYTPCEKCVHQDVCKMKREFGIFVSRIDGVDKTLTNDNIIRFRNFNAHAVCTNYIESRGCQR